MCSGKAARRRKAYGCRIKRSRRIAGVAERMSSAAQESSPPVESTNIGKKYPAIVSDAVR
jgi:hypothetical protein